MVHRLDTGFLVAAEVVEHADHAAARHTLARLVAAGDRLAIAPQILAEFIHVVTDPRRFAQPLQMDDARHLAQQWWTAREVDRVFPNEAATQQFLAWLGQFSLGRKRLLDTLLAATYHRELPTGTRSGSKEKLPSPSSPRSGHAGLRHPAPRNDRFATTSARCARPSPGVADTASGVH